MSFGRAQQGGRSSKSFGGSSRFGSTRQRLNPTFSDVRSAIINNKFGVLRRVVSAKQRLLRESDAVRPHPADHRCLVVDVVLQPHIHAGGACICRLAKRHCTWQRTTAM